LASSLGVQRPVIGSVAPFDVARGVVGSAAARASDEVVGSMAVAVTDVTCSVVGAVAAPDVAGRVVGSILGDGDTAARHRCCCDRGRE